MTTLTSLSSPRLKNPVPWSIKKSEAYRCCQTFILGLQTLESVECYLPVFSTTIEAADLVVQVQEKTFAEDIDLPDGTELYYSDPVHGRLIGVVSDSRLEARHETQPFLVPLCDGPLSVIVVTVVLNEITLTSGYRSEALENSEYVGLSRGPWNYYTIADFLEILDFCSALENPSTKLTVGQVTTPGAFPALTALSDSLGSSLSLQLAYEFIEARLLAATKNTGPDNPLKTYTMPPLERFVLWAENARTWSQAGTFFREFHFNRLWPGWSSFHIHTF
ncbi:hypothetical protein FRC07_006750 [Ceratobasidium sp. 392]|nr:hypothetical protein FRC07_006750 [Ceratobasidium sp. 392]